MTYPSRSLDRIIIRLPHGLREKLKEAASDNRRSMNAEAVVILEAHLTQTKTAGAPLTAPPTV